MRKFTEQESEEIAETISAVQPRKLGRNQLEYLRRLLMSGTSSGVVYVYQSYSARIRQTLVEAGILTEHERSDEYIVKPELLPEWAKIKV